MARSASAWILEDWTRVSQRLRSSPEKSVRSAAGGRILNSATPSFQESWLAQLMRLRVPRALLAFSILGGLSPFQRSSKRDVPCVLRFSRWRLIRFESASLCGGYRYSGVLFGARSLFLSAFVRAACSCVSSVLFLRDPFLVAWIVSLTAFALLFPDAMDGRHSLYQRRAKRMRVLGWGTAAGPKRRKSRLAERMEKVEGEIALQKAREPTLSRERMDRGREKRK